MKNLEQIEQQLDEMVLIAQNANLEQLKKSKKECDKILKYLLKSKNYYIKTTKIEIKPIKLLIKKAKTTNEYLKKLINKKINEQLSIEENEILFEKFSKEDKEIIKIKNGNMSLQKKIEQLKNIEFDYSKSDKFSDNDVDSKFTLPFSYKQIKSIDKKYNINIMEIIKKINAAEDKDVIIKETISLLEEILIRVQEDNAEKYMVIYSVILKQLENNKKTDVVNSYLKTLKKLDKKAKEEINIIKYLIENLKLYLSKYNKLIKNEIVEDDEINLTEKQRLIVKNMIKYENSSDYEPIDIIIAFCYFIQEYPILENKDVIKDYAYYISYVSQEYFMNNNEIFLEYIYLLNAIKLKINKTKKNSEERKFLKTILRKFKNIYDIYKTPIKNNILNDSYFDMINYWLEDEKNYLYIKELLRRKNTLCNLKYNDKHIVIYILDLYIENYKKMLKNNKSEYINIDYLEKVYFLFTKNPGLRISEEERNIIDNKLKEFEIYLKTAVIKSKLRNYIHDKIKKLYSTYFYKEYKYYNFENFSDDVLSYESNNVTNMMKLNLKKDNVKEATLYGKDAYTIEENEDNHTFLTIYSIMYYYYISEHSTINRYLQKCELNHEEVDSFFKYMLSFKLNEIYPAIGYELEFDSRGVVVGFKLKKETIKITEKCLHKQDSTNTKMIYDLYQKSAIKNNSNIVTFDTIQINRYFEKLLEKEFIEFLKQERLPYIYYGYSKVTSKEKEKNINDLANILYKLDKNESAEVINMLLNEIDSYHYSNLPMENGEYKLNLLNPISYLGLEQQRMLDDLYFNIRKYESAEKLHNLKLVYLDKYIKEVEELNANVDYVDPYVMKLSKGKIKNQIRL